MALGGAAAKGEHRLGNCFFKQKRYTNFERKIIVEKQTTCHNRKECHNRILCSRKGKRQSNSIVKLNGKINRKSNIASKAFSQTITQLQITVMIDI